MSDIYHPGDNKGLTEYDFGVFLGVLIAQIKLLVGLGNPGKKYALTRHNMGYMVLDYLAAKNGRKFTTGKGQWSQARLALDNSELWAIKPETYMNLSGSAVRAFCDYFKIEPEEILVVCDDINLAVGKLRIRDSGSAGGHKGLEDIIQTLGSDNFARLRLGIGLPPEGLASEDYVLKRFDDNETNTIAEMIKTAASALSRIYSEGIEAAQNDYN